MYQQPPEVLATGQITPNTGAPQALINKYAEKYNVSPKTMLAVMSCENPTFDPDLQSRIIQRDGTREPSYGLVQIHLPSHPSVSYQQAIDPEYSVSFLAEKLSKGDGRLWTCYRTIFGSTWKMAEYIKSTRSGKERRPPN